MAGPWTMQFTIYLHWMLNNSTAAGNFNGQGNLGFGGVLGVDKPKELPKTRMMQSWFESGKVEPLNYPKVHTMICPASGKGSTLDLAVITPGLKSSVLHWIRGDSGRYTEQ